MAVKVNTALQKMQAGDPAYGYALGLGSPIAAEALAGSGIDFILLDNQHGSWGPESTILGLLALAAGRATPMVRPARNDYTLIGRALDEGALGIVVPMVETPEQAKAAADACRFAPHGARSFGYGRAASYGADYVEWIDAQLFVAIQLESAAAVEQAEAIMATPGIDGCWVGPADLALSIGIKPSQATGHDRHERLLEQVVQACRNTGTIPGLACWNATDALKRAGQGFQFLTAGSDSGFLQGGAQSGVRELGLG